MKMTEQSPQSAALPPHEEDPPHLHHHHVSSANLRVEAGPTVFKKAGEVLEIQNLILYPWSTTYKVFWGFTVFCASLTIFTETYGIAFTSAGLTPYNDGSSILELLLVGIFVLDIIANFCLAYYDEETGELVTQHSSIAKRYVTRGTFWIDLIGVFPFYAIALACAGEIGSNSTTAQYLALLRLARMVRLHRLGLVFEILQYSSKISLMSLTLTRNFTMALVWCHFAACVFYFIARQYNFSSSTWISSDVDDMNGMERYLTSLYFAVVTFTTVGYGDYSPVNPAEQIWGILFMLINIIFMSWVIGSITLLIVKVDEKTGDYRDSLERLKRFSDMHDLDAKLHKRLKTQLKLEFNTREVNDEQVLSGFPTATRAKVLRRLYLPALMHTQLLSGLRQQFTDAFLAACKVEIISPGEELLQRGSIASDLYFLVSGTVTLKLSNETNEVTYNDSTRSSTYGEKSVVGSEYANTKTEKGQEVDEGDFINEISFFTESPQAQTVITKTVCNTLTMSKANYKLIADDYPDCVGVVLHNLLEKVKANSSDSSSDDSQEDYALLSSAADVEPDQAKRMQQSTVILAVEDLVQAHMHKMRDDHTTQFLFAASRGDSKSVAYMCENDFDPNNADYDQRTALMVASMNGHTSTVAKLLEYGADVNLLDMHGTSCLFEAARNGHEETVHLLQKNGATLGMNNGQAASRLCQAVFDGDMILLRRLLQAKIDVNAADYDKRTAAHIAAAEGNLVALKLLVEFGATVLRCRDRWDNSVEKEAENSKSSEELLKYLNTLHEDQTS